MWLFLPKSLLLDEMLSQEVVRTFYFLGFFTSLKKNTVLSYRTTIMVSCLFLRLVPCFPAPNITCKDFGGNETHFTGREVGFFKPISCRNV